MFKARLIGFMALALMIGLVISSGHAFAAARHTLHADDGSTYFMLNNGLSFSAASGTGMDNGATINLDPNAVEGSVTTTFQHTIFVQDSSGNITVYSTGNDPVNAQVSQNADGSTSIAYSISGSNSSDSFNGTLSNGQMTATYQQDFIGGATVGGQEYMGGTNISATFTAAVNWITADQIPAAPSNGQYQLSSDGGVLLSWSPAQSSNVSGYDVYRMVLGVDTQQQFQTTTTDTSYSDESSEAIQNAQTVTGVMYTIYAVGPSGIENPEDVVIYAASI